MKALVIERPEVLAVREIPIPEIGEYDALCELLYGATCTGTDLHIIHGNFGIPIDYPTIIGHESTGRVLRCGSKVRNYKPGDLISRVGAPAALGIGLNTSWGGMAQYGVARDHLAMKEDGCDPALWDAYRVNNVIPEGLIDPLDATMIITWRETLSYVKRMGVGPGQRILVSGSGANGCSIARQAINMGAEAYMIGSGSRKYMKDKLGFTEYLDYRDEAAVEKFIEGNLHGFDYVIDATGKSGSLNKLLKLVKDGGTVGCYGMDDYLNYNFMPLNADVSFRFYNGGYDEQETHEHVLDLIRQGKLDASAWLDKEHVFDIEEADKAYEWVKNKHAIKSVVKLS